MTPRFPPPPRDRLVMHRPTATGTARTTGYTPDHEPEDERKEATVSTLFTKIINGELPGRFIWKDPDVVAFLSIGPLTDGHTLVVPRQEIDQWTDAEPDLLAKLTGVARIIGRAQTRAFGSERAGLMVAGFEVPHLHVHVWPTNSLADFDLSRADTDPKAARLDENAEKLRSALREDGHTDTVPAS